jgi:uncharacterized protein
MKLKLLEQNDPWYSQGLQFTCTQCGNCCTGGPGYVWISPEEIVRLAEHLAITPEETVERYCRRVNGRFSLKERRTPEGLYDCIFLKEIDVDGAREGIASRRKACSVYAVRPLQCRTWPFWPENLASPESWKNSGKRCHGMDNGPRVFTQKQIESIRDSADWPKNPPTSGPGTSRDNS